MAGPSGSKRYAPLAAFLAEQSARTTTVTLTLGAIEQLIGQPLPAAASTQTWWAVRRDGAQARPWVVAGWRVAGVAMRIAVPTVTFARLPDSTPSSLVPQCSRPAESAGERRRGGCRIGDG